ncbi:uncharacterized protein [Magallana gigas]|uniref:uncharacterized protein isoform X2 n=1 Tax=Magallana gigas TaxID=29159 RepID=UPI00333E9B38
MEACYNSFGPECVRPCPLGFHGIQCSEKCRCDICNASTGECSKKTTTTENRAKDFFRYERSRSGEILWLPILLGVFASVGSLAAVLFFMNLRERRNTQDPNTQGQEQSNYVKELYLPRVYDQLRIDDRSPVYCDVIESEEDKTPNIYTECVRSCVL